MATAIRKWGNSLGIRLPQAVLEQTKLTEGSTVEVSVEGETIVIRPAARVRGRYRLSDLLADSPAGNEAIEVWDGPQGREVW